MAVYRLWREPFTDPFMQVDANDDATAVAWFAQELGETLTLEKRPDVAPYLMDCMQANTGARFTRPDIPVWVKDPDSPK